MPPSNYGGGSKDSMRVVLAVIEDDGLLRAIREQFLRAHNFTVNEAPNREEDLNLAMQHFL